VVTFIFIKGPLPVLPRCVLAWLRQVFITWSVVNDGCLMLNSLDITPLFQGSYRDIIKQRNSSSKNHICKEWQLDCLCDNYPDFHSSHIYRSGLLETPLLVTWPIPTPITVTGQGVGAPQNSFSRPGETHLFVSLILSLSFKHKNLGIVRSSIVWSGNWTKQPPAKENNLSGAVKLYIIYFELDWTRWSCQYLINEVDTKFISTCAVWNWYYYRHLYFLRQLIFVCLFCSQE
jgi:hypothetical protein